MLPDILEIAKQHQLTFHSKTFGKKQTAAKCPFCEEDSLPHKKKKYYLSLNTADMLFRCWYCQEQGGVFRFMSLLEGRAESEIIAEYRKKNGSTYKLHPAEKLTSSQLKLIGLKKPDWMDARKTDVEQYKKLRRYINKAWEQYLDKELRTAYRFLYLGAVTGTFQKQIEEVKKREQAIGAKLYKQALKLLSLSNRPTWCREDESFVLEVCFSKQSFNQKE